MRRPETCLPTLLFACLVLCSCSAERTPRLERWQNGAYQIVELSSHTISGRRDGATTIATARFMTVSGHDLRLELEIHYDPTPTLRSGSWTVDHSESMSVRAESVEFVGGQGEGPSIGGVFVLERDDMPAYRVDLPLQPVTDRGWEVHGRLRDPRLLTAYVDRGRIDAGGQS